MKFYINGGGDSSVGIPMTESTIEIKDNYEWDYEMIKMFKDFINEFYDNGKLEIYTEEEYNKVLEEERKHHKESLINDILDISDKEELKDFLNQVL
ncbi:hypothetical protein KY321_00490 [Candidatus Woesearchaeota archaeon]|nr:hypothetical protein [Candidatus Woesearchaeota archaeon]